MGFYITGTNQIRFRISYKAYETILQDIDDFQNVPDKEQISSFLNRIIKNFYLEAESSISEGMERRYNKYLEWLDGVPEREKTAMILTEREKSAVRNEIERKYGQPQKGKGQNLKLILTNRVRDIFMYSKENSIYDDKISDYIAALVQEYTTFSREDRERIYFNEMYLQIQNCIDSKYEMEIVSSDTAFIFKPYQITTNGIMPYLYIIGYSRLKDGDTGNEKTASFRLSRIQSLESKTNHRFSFSKEQKNELQTIMSNKSQITYLTGENKKITVRLTKNGYRLFSNIIISGRPCYTEKIIVSDDDIRLDFCCTEEQIYQYFVRFGADAEIMDPQELRNRFRDMYRELTERYN